MINISTESLICQLLDEPIHIKTNILWLCNLNERLISLWRCVTVLKSCQSQLQLFSRHTDSENTSLLINHLNISLHFFYTFIVIAFTSALCVNRLYMLKAHYDEVQKCPLISFFWGLGWIWWEIYLYWNVRLLIAYSKEQFDMSRGDVIIICCFFLTEKPNI